MKKLKTFISVMVLFVMATCMCLAFAGCNTDVEKEPKRAIIYVTALMSGGLYDTAEEKAVWAPYMENYGLRYLLGDGSTNVIDFNVIMANIMGLSKEDKTAFNGLLGMAMSIVKNEDGNLLQNIMLNQYGESLNPNIISTTYLEGITSQYFGVGALYQEIIMDLRERFDNKCDVCMFDYDWRVDNRINSQKLEEFINGQGYDEVIILSQSMGGPVTAGYLARSAENRKKVVGYLAYCGAFIGSLDAIAALENPLFMIGTMAGMDSNPKAPLTLPAITSVDDETAAELNALLGNMTGGNILINSLLNSLDLQGVLNDSVYPLVQNMTSIMQLLPTIEYILSDQYGSDESALYIDGVAVRTKEKLMEFYSTRPWSYLTDEDGNYIPVDKNDLSKGYQLKPYVEQLGDYFDSLYVDVNGEKVFATSLVNTYYLYGSDCTTRQSYYWDTKTQTGHFTYTKNASGSNPTGDGTVPKYCALGGQKSSNIAADHLYDYSGNMHMALGTDWADVKNDDGTTEMSQMRADALAIIESLTSDWKVVETETSK